MLDLAVSGVEDMLANIGKTVKSIQRDPEGDLREALEPVRARMEELAPRRSGFLASEIVIGEQRLEGSAITATAGGAALGVGPSRRAWYAHFAEFGTVNMAAEPFVRPAWEQTQDQVIDILGERLSRRLETSL